MREMANIGLHDPTKMTAVLLAYKEIINVNKPALK